MFPQYVKVKKPSQSWKNPETKWENKSCKEWFEMCSNKRKLVTQVQLISQYLFNIYWENTSLMIVSYSKCCSRMTPIQKNASPVSAAFECTLLCRNPVFCTCQSWLGTLKFPVFFRSWSLSMAAQPNNWNWLVRLAASDENAN